MLCECCVTFARILVLKMVWGKKATPRIFIFICSNPFQLSTILLTDFMNKKKPTKNKPKVISFTDLVQALNNKSNFTDNSGKGIVKGKDVSRMNDFLKQK